MELRKANELKLPQNIRVMVFGQSGAGKTTLALSMPKPVLLDFDNGVSRVNFAHLDGVATAQIGKWEDLSDLFTSGVLNDYETVIIDTASKMMDYIIDFKVKGRQPQLRDWSGINAEVVNFMRNLSMSGKNIVYVAQRDSYKDGDNTIYIPSMRAKNLAPIITELDLLGYVEIKGGQRTITFNPTERSEGKNTCGLPAVMVIPELPEGTPNTFLTDKVLKVFRGNLAKKKQLNDEYQDKLNQYKSLIDGITDAETANAVVVEICKLKPVGNIKVAVGTMLKAKVAELNLTLDKETKKYV